MKIALAALALTLACTVGCIDNRVYMDPVSDFGLFGSNGGAALRGDVGQLTGLDTIGRDISFYGEGADVTFTGNVPHQTRPTSSVYIDVAVLNAGRMPIGSSVEQDVAGDVYGAEDMGDEPSLSVYICPNGEGVSGSADHIIVTRTGEETFEFVATSSVPEQNLDIDLVVAGERDVDQLAARAQQGG